MLRKKILCIGDSLALPGHLNRYEDTWFYLLKNEFPDFDFISFFKRQLTTDILTTMGGGVNGVDQWPKGADCLEAYMPDLVVLQLGIVDCAPRLLNIFDKMVLKVVPSNLTTTYIRLIKKVRSRKTTNTYVTTKRFRENLENYFDRTSKTNTHVVIISISMPDQAFLQKNPDSMANIYTYNNIFTQLGERYNNVSITTPLDPAAYSFPVYEDGYHPNAYGHRIIFEKLKGKLRKEYE